MTTDIITDKKGEAFGIVQRLRGEGFQAFIVGGAVRDMVMGIPPKDYDIATDASPEEVERLFERVYPVGAKFGVSMVLLGKNTYEVAMFRRDGAYVDGRRPTRVDRSDEVEDVRRRDFTINALLYDPEKDRIYDHVGGVEDIQRGIIRSVGDPFQRFEEDRLRMLRAVRFAARFGFVIEPKTMEAIRRNAVRVVSVSFERIGEELSRMFTGSHPELALDLLDESGLLEVALPEVAALKGVEQSPEHHPEGDVYAHTRLMLKLFGGGSQVMAFAALLHDIGKPATFTLTDRARFNRHDEIGAEIAETVLRRLRFSGDTITRVHELVRKHMQFMNVPRMKRSTLLRFMARPDFGELLELHRLDCLASHCDLSTYDFLKGEMRREREENHPLTLPEPLLRGDDLIALGMEPGPQFGEILREAMDAQLEGAIRTKDDALKMARENWSPHPSRKTLPRRKNTGGDPPASRGA